MRQLIRGFRGVGANITFHQLQQQITLMMTTMMMMMMSKSISLTKYNVLTRCGGS